MVVVLKCINGMKVMTLKGSNIEEDAAAVAICESDFKDIFWY